MVERNEQADRLLNKEFPVLDYGFVRLVDYMGSDAAIVQAARVSYGKGTKKSSEDRALIRYLMRRRHTSPFEMAEMKFHVKLPIFVARQWIRHRTASVNEYSGRYSVMKDEFYIPRQEDIRYQSTVNKQGRADDEVPPELSEWLLEYLTRSQTDSYDKYTEFVDSGMARELARIALPLSLYTEWYWKMDLHNLLHFLKLRLDSHAQLEIREYAKVISQIVQAAYPMTWEAFVDYSLNSICFSGPELALLRPVLKDIEINEVTASSAGLSKREIGELAEKLRRLNSDGER